MALRFAAVPKFCCFDSITAAEDRRYPMSLRFSAVPKFCPMKSIVANSGRKKSWLPAFSSASSHELWMEHGRVYKDAAEKARRLCSSKMSASDSNRQEEMGADSDHREEVVVIKRTKVGDIREIVGFKNDPELCSKLHELGRFAVDEHNKKQNAAVEYIGVLKAKRQVVSGMMFYLDVEVVEGGTKRVYAAKVWEQPWMDFKQVQHFIPLGDPVSPSPAAAPSCGCAPER